jgi:hypothetical protein
MIPVHQTPAGHLANVRVIANVLSEGYRGFDAIERMRWMVMDIRNAVYREGGDFRLVEAWLGQACEILDTVVYQQRAMDDLDFGALKECLTEAACALR